METNAIVIRVIDKVQDHVDGSPLMRYTFEVIYDPKREGRAGELITKWLQLGEDYTVGKMYAMYRDFIW